MERAFESLGKRTMVVVLLVLAAYSVLLTLSTVLNYTLRYPFQDQFRLNLRYLTTPFPENVLLLENGHRPVLPGVVRLVELKWLEGTQFLQVLTAWLAAIAAAAILLVAGRRELRGSPLLAAAGICVICTTLFWNANARMFIHAYEATHVFYVTFFTVTAIHFAVNSPGKAGWQLWAASVAACVAATFSFGMGIASFAAVMTVACLRRSGRRPWTLILIAAAATFVVYYVLLPGAEGVQHAVAGLSLHASVFFTLARVGAVFAEFMRLFVPDLGRQAAVAALAGAVSITLMSASILWRWRQRVPFVGTELYGAALFAFGLLTNALIATTRTAYLFEHTEQLFADRYLYWSSLTWLGVFIYWLGTLVHVDLAKQCVAIAATFLFAGAAIPPAWSVNQWAAEVYRLSTMSAIALKLGIRNDVQVAEISADDNATTYRSVDEMRKRNLGMFADTSNLRVGDNLPLGQPIELAVPSEASRVYASSPAGTSVRMVSGELPPAVAAQAQEADLWFVESDGTLIGRAAFTSIGSQPQNVFRVGVPTLTGFQGYALQSATHPILIALYLNGDIKQLSRLNGWQ